MDFDRVNNKLKSEEEINEEKVKQWYNILSRLLGEEYEDSDTDDPDHKALNKFAKVVPLIPE